MSALAYSLGAGAVLATLAHGAYYRNSPVFGGAMGQLAEGGRRVALTFDDGPNPDTTPAVLDALRAANVRATFFLLGRHVDRWPDLVRRARAEGHEVANHGYAHRKLTYRSPAYVRDDIAGGTAAIERATGTRPRYFRAPHGFRSPWVGAIARGFGQRVVGWTLGVWDTALPGSDVIAARTIAGARPGAIILLHDGDGYDPLGDRRQTAAALPRIIDGLRGRGFDLVTLGAA